MERILIDGNRTRIVLRGDADHAVVHKELRSFADVESERRALYREAYLQHLGRGAGVVPILGYCLKQEAGPPEEEHRTCRSLRRPFITGFSLRELVQATALGQFEREVLTGSALRWMRLLLGIVDFLHEFPTPRRGHRGLVHRDITPDNVLLDDEGKIWLNDFGLARGIDEPPLEDDELFQGSRSFLPPEILRGKQPSRAGDVYQIALLTRLLLEPELVRSSETLRSSQGLSGLPSVVQDALDPEPTERPSVRTFRDGLGRALLDR